MILGVLIAFQLVASPVLRASAIDEQKFCVSMKQTARLSNSQKAGIASVPLKLDRVTVDCPHRQVTYFKSLVADGSPRLLARLERDEKVRWAKEFCGNVTFEQMALRGWKFVEMVKGGHKELFTVRSVCKPDQL